MPITETHERLHGELPTQTQEQRQKLSRKRQEIGLKPPCLIVESEKLTHGHLEGLLRFWKFDVISFEKAADAGRWIDALAVADGPQLEMVPKLAIIAATLDDGSGLEIARRLRACQLLQDIPLILLLQDIPLILLTHPGSLPEKVEGLAHGIHADLVLTKPLYPSANLREAIYKLLPR